MKIGSVSLLKRDGGIHVCGGSTQTIALLPGSPAINAGNANGCTDARGNTLTVDQRGYPRPDSFSGLCDIGAFELQACSTLATVLGLTTTGQVARLGVILLPNPANPLAAITFRVGSNSFVACAPLTGAASCVNQGMSNATALITGMMDSAWGSAFATGHGVKVLIQLSNQSGAPQVDVTDTTTGVTYTIMGPFDFGSAIRIV